MLQPAIHHAIEELQARGAEHIVLVASSNDVILDLTVRTLWELAHTWASTALQKHSLRLITPDEQELIISELWHQLEPSLSEKAKASLGSGAGLLTALTATISELRLFGINSENLAHESFLVKDRGIIIGQLLTGYENHLHKHKLVDPARLAQLAMDEVLENGIEQHLIIASRLTGPTTLLSLLDQVPDDHKIDLRQASETAMPLLDSITDAGRLRYLKSPQSAPPALKDGTLTMYRALSPEFEVRAVLGKLLQNNIPFDQAEVLYTEDEVYPSLFFQIMAATQPGQKPALTFRGGIPVRWTRPGKALLFWLDWLSNHYTITPLVEAVQQGVLKLPTYIKPLEWFSLIRSLPSHSTAGAWQQFFAKQRAESRLPANHQEAMDWLADMMLSMIAGWDKASSAADHMKIALRWLKNFVAITDEWDKQTAQLLEHHLSVHQLSRSATKESILYRLSAWANEARLPPEPMKPGTLALTPLSRMESLQRPHTFCIGLCEDWYPTMPVRTSLLTDRERKNISPELQEQSIREVMQRQEAGIIELLGQLPGNVVFTYPCADQLDDRERFPSQLFLRIFRLTAELPEGDLQECESWLEAPLGPETNWCRLTELESWLNRWPSQPYTDALFKNDFLWLCRGAYAGKQRRSYRFTEHDGHVQEAGSEFDTKSMEHVYSAHSLQRYARCPQLFFLQDVLKVKTLDDRQPEAGHWLHPLIRGEILHAVFHQYHLQLLKQKRTPNKEKDRTVLNKLLQAELAKVESELPPVTQHIRLVEVQELEETLNIFLGEEAQWTESYQPRHFEVTIGSRSEEIASDLDSPSPINVRLPSGRSILMQGRVDRIDEITGSDGKEFFIWDYKTGKMREYLGSQARRTGQLLQPLLYLEMVERRLREKIGADARVMGAGYFFPGQRGGQGDRLQWSAEDLRKDSNVLDTMLDLLQAGIFLATDQPDTCKHCSYFDACEVPEVNRQAGNKQKQIQNGELVQLRQFRKAP